jgi:hypothetical protein
LKEEYIMNVVYKSQVREQSSDALQQFFARGGQVQVVKARKSPTPKMLGKNSRGFRTGTSGFATGYPSKSL